MPIDLFDFLKDLSQERHRAIILPSVKTIGNGAVIAAGSVVTHDVPPYAVVAGVPDDHARPPAFGSGTTGTTRANPGRPGDAKPRDW